MNTRTITVFAVALVVLAALAAFGHLNGDAADNTNSGALFMPELKAKLAEVDHVTVTKAGDKPVATLVREKAGWVMAQKDNYPANVKQIRDALVGLSKAHVVETKTSNPDYYSRLGVEPVKLDNATGAQIELLIADKPVATVTIGKSAGLNGRYVRNNAGQASYLVDQALEIPTNTSSWLAPDIVDIDAKRVKSVTVTQANGDEVKLIKANPDQPNFTVENIPQGRELQYPGVADVIGGALHKLTLQDVAKVTDPAATPDVTVQYETFDGLLVTVQGTKQKADQTWIEVSAAVDPTQAAATASQKKADVAGMAAPDKTSNADAASNADKLAGDATAAKDEGKQADQDKSVTHDPKAEAAAINARVGGWKYKIASYQYDQMTRKMDDLLKAKKEEAKGK